MSALLKCPVCSCEIPSTFKFCGQCGHRLASAEGTAASVALPPTVEPLSDPKPPATADSQLQSERREVVVLFADVKGYTSMSERLDPEEVHRVMNECFDGLAGAVVREEGTVDKYIGDNIMAVFGAPIAHEDDPARACRAALEMQEFLAGFAAKYEGRIGVRLQMRIGLHHGLVVSGGVGARDVRLDYSVMGDTVNTAARLESNAPPGGVLVSRAVMRNAGKAFRFSEERLLTLKGKSRPFSTFELLGTVDDDAQAASESPFVGRDDEIAMLLNVVSAETSEHLYCIVWGEVGIGKSRLCKEVLRRCDHRSITVQGSSAIRGRSLGLVRRLLRELIFVVTGDRVNPSGYEELRAATAPMTANGFDFETYGKVLWYIIGPVRDAAELPDPDPQTTQRLIRRCVASMLDAVTASLGTLVVFVDAYDNVDAESEEIIRRALGEVARPFRIMATTRGAASRTEHTESMRLLPLAEDSSRAMFDALVGHASLPESLVSDVVQRAAGIPLFLEELVHELFERAVLVRDSGTVRFESDGAVGTAIALPSSLRAAMLARFDQLDPRGKALLSVAAVQGAEFFGDITARILRARDWDDRAVTRTMTELVQRNFIEDATLGERPVYRFCNPLMQEAVYEMSLLSERREIHAKVAEGIAEIAGGEALGPSEVLAHHWESAHEWERASAAMLRLGREKAGLYLNDSVIACCDAALRLADKIEHAPDRSMLLRAEARLLKADVLLRIGRSDDARDCVDAVLGEPPSLPLELEARLLRATLLSHGGALADAAQTASWVLERALAEPRFEAFAVRCLQLSAEIALRDKQEAQALHALDRARSLAAAETDLVRIQLATLEGRIAHAHGRLDDAAAAFERAHSHVLIADIISERARVLNCLGNVERDRGHYERAVDRFTEALSLWKRAGLIESIAGAENNIGNIFMSQGDFDAARRHLGRAFVAWRDSGNVRGAAIAQTNLAMLALEAGSGEEAAALAEAASRTLGPGDSWLGALIEVVHAEGLTLLGRFGEVEDRLGKLMQQCTEESHPLARASALRALGRVELARGKLEAGFAYLDAALAIFTKIQRAQERGRTMLVIARVHMASGRVEPARTSIEEARAIFATLNAKSDLHLCDELAHAIDAGVTCS